MKMTSLIIAAIAAVLLAVLVGCQSHPDTSKDMDIVQQVLSDVLGDKWSGDVHIDHSNAYFDFKIDGVNVHKDAAGKWVFDSLRIERRSHFPLWSSTGNINFGAPQIAAPRGTDPAVVTRTP